MNKPLFSSRSGTGEPIVLLHGFLSDSRYWKPLLPYLEKRYTVVRIDLRGFGRSPKPRHVDAYSLDEHVTAVHNALTELGITRTSFMGHSLGALVAAEYSRRYPEAVSKLYLLNMPIFTSDHQAKQELLATNVLYKTFLFSVRERPFWIASKLLMPIIGTKKVRRVFSARHTQASRVGTMQNTILTTNGLALLQSLRVPTVLVVGAYDRLVYSKNLELVNLPENISVRWVETGHHTVHSKKVRPDDYLA